MPFGGYRFLQLQKACNPYIFMAGTNKACLRKAAEKLLPEAIRRNTLKHGNSGVTLGKVMRTGDNRTKVKNYIRSHSSTLVDTETLLKKADGDFGQDDFLALSLLVFENTLKDEYGISVGL